MELFGKIPIIGKLSGDTATPAAIPGEREIEKLKIPDVDRARTERIMDLLRSNPENKILESPVTLADFPAVTDYSKFATLPPATQKQLQRLTMSCRAYIAGFLLLDKRTI